MTPIAVTQLVVAKSRSLDKDGCREQIAQLRLWPNPAQMQDWPRGGTSTCGHGLRTWYRGIWGRGGLIPLPALAELCLVQDGWGVMPDAGGSRARMCPAAWLAFHSIGFWKTNAIAGHPSSGAQLFTPAERGSASQFFPARGCSLTTPLLSDGSLPTSALGSSAAISCPPHQPAGLGEAPVPPPIGGGGSGFMLHAAPWPSAVLNGTLGTSPPRPQFPAVSS